MMKKEILSNTSYFLPSDPLCLGQGRGVHAAAESWTRGLHQMPPQVAVLTPPKPTATGTVSAKRGHQVPRMGSAPLSLFQEAFCSMPAPRSQASTSRWALSHAGRASPRNKTGRAVPVNDGPVRGFPSRAATSTHCHGPRRKPTQRPLAVVGGCRHGTETPREFTKNQESRPAGHGINGARPRLPHGPPAASEDVGGKTVTIMRPRRRE